MKNERKIEKEKVENINGIKNHTAQTIALVHSLSFGIFEVLYILLDYFLGMYLPDMLWGKLLEAIFCGCAYWCIYKIVKLVVEKMWISKKTKYKIEGIWHHVHIPHTWDEKKLSAGKTTIKREVNDFTFSGENFHYNVEGGKAVRKGIDTRTEWYTETSEICDDNNEMDIIEIYKAVSGEVQKIPSNECPLCKCKLPEDKERPEQAGRIRHGIHIYKIKKDKDEIVCQYSDCYPSLKSGVLYLYKDEARRDERIMEYFETQAQIMQKLEESLAKETCENQ